MPTARLEATNRSASSRSAVRRLAPVLASTAVAVILWTVIDPVAGVDLVVQTAEGPRPIGVAGVSVAAFVAGLAAWASLAVVERRAVRPAVVWRRLALVGLAVSLVGPLTGTTTAAKVGLACLHVTVAVVLLSLLGPTAIRKTAAGDPI